MKIYNIYIILIIIIILILMLIYYLYLVFCGWGGGGWVWPHHRAREFGSPGPRHTDLCAGGGGGVMWIIPSTYPASPRPPGLPRLPIDTVHRLYRVMAGYSILMGPSLRGPLFRSLNTRVIHTCLLGCAHTGLLSEYIVCSVLYLTAPQGVRLNGVSLVNKL